MLVTHCKKYSHIHGCFVAASFPYLKGTGSAYVCIGNSRRSNEARTWLCIRDLQSFAGLTASARFSVTPVCRYAAAPQLVVAVLTTFIGITKHTGPHLAGGGTGTQLTWGH